jgi:hypothetical protein
LKLLIDECLSPELAKAAMARGYESTHIGWLKRHGSKDWQIRPLIIEGDWTFVTRNAVDFRGPSAAPGTKGQYAGVELHAGLICLIGPSLDIDLQLELFEHALDELDAKPDLVNQGLDVILTEGGVHLFRYALP